MIQYNVNRNRNPRLSVSEIEKLPTELKYEFTLDTDDYRGILTEVGLLAYARLIVNLLFLKPGTYPNSPDMGINIQQYSFEIMDEEFLSNLEDNIRKQIEMFMPGNLNIDVFVEMVQPKDSLKKILGIAFRLNAEEGTDPTQLFVFIKDENGSKTSHVVIP